ncbi:hypothetical protein AN958_01058 [Leucoagaricus sp. SymC.cos]|nr:hypothetical protein AN958_01058 [Leucoagaricus sp. SymC.cos]
MRGTKHGEFLYTYFDRPNTANQGHIDSSIQLHKRALFACAQYGCLSARAAERHSPPKCLILHIRNSCNSSSEHYCYESVPTLVSRASIPVSTQRPSVVIRSRLDPSSCLYRISRLIEQGRRKASIIPVNCITQSAHLFPKSGPRVSPEWTSAST